MAIDFTVSSDQALNFTTSADQSANFSAESAGSNQAASLHPPYIGTNGNWYQYDLSTQQFVDSGYPSRGQTGEKGDRGDGTYPIVSSPAWNSEMRAGSVTPAVTLPTPPTTTTAELRYIFTALSASASFTAPSGYILGGDDGFSGLTAGNTLSLTGLTVGSIYECSFAVIDSTHIGMYIKEWKV